MSLADRQALLARFIDDEALEARVRADPDAMAEELGVPADLTRWLATLTAERVASFRRSRVHKGEVRAGKPATRLDS